MNTPTYAEQFNKITGAYIRGEIDPWVPCACFIGNLLNNNPDWIYARIGLSCGNVTNNTQYLDRSQSCIDSESNSLYSINEVIKLENNFVRTFCGGRQTEEALFFAMSSTLDMLRELHISKGENVDAIPFTKRELVS